MRKLIAAAAITVASLGIVETPAEATHDRVCRRSATINTFTTSRSRCFRIQRHNEMFRDVVVLVRRSDNTRWVLRGQWRDCNGQVSSNTWIRSLYVWVSHRTRIAHDTLPLGC